jgi:hypothetical protein
MMQEAEEMILQSSSRSGKSVPSVGDKDKTSHSSHPAAAVNNYVTKINELKNRLFVMEIELSNERKKLCVEKEAKAKSVCELKGRFETEKEAALMALEARLNAEKLIEINKLKETIEGEKRDEMEMISKSFDAEMMSLKLKLRDRSERCGFHCSYHIKDLSGRNWLFF